MFSCDLRGALNASVAYVMATLAEPHRTERFVNLLCGSATLLIERLSLGPARLALGVDSSEPALACAACDGALYRGKHVGVVGGGDSAVDWGLNLQGTARSITLVHRRDEFRAHESSVNELKASPVRILTPDRHPLEQG